MLRSLATLSFGQLIQRKAKIGGPIKGSQEQINALQHRNKSLCEMQELDGGLYIEVEL